MTLWAYGSLNLMPPQSAFDALEAKAANLAPEMKCHEVANAIWAFATLNTPPVQRTAEALEDAIVRTAPTFKGQNVANTLWAQPAVCLSSTRVQETDVPAPRRASRRPTCS